MPAPNTIVLNVQFQTADAQQNITQLNQGIAAIGTTATQASTASAAGVAKTTQSVQGLTVSIQQASQSVLSFGQALTGLGIARIAQETLALGQEMQRLRMGFENAPGGLEQWQKLHEMAAVTGADFKELVNNANTFRKAGLSTQDIERGLRALQDQMIRTGASQQDLNDTVSKIASITAGDWVNARALVGLRVLGLEPAREAATRLGLSMAQFRHETAQLSSDEMVRLIFEMAEAQSGGFALAKSNQLLSTSFNKLKTEWAETARIIVDRLGPSISHFLDQLTELAKWARENADSIKKIFDWGVTAVEILAVSKSLSMLSGAITTVGTAAAQAAPGMAAFFAVFTADRIKVLLGTAVLEFIAFQKMFHDMTSRFDVDEQRAQQATYDARQETVKQYFATVTKYEELTHKKLLDDFTPFGRSTDEIIARTQEIQKLMADFKAQIKDPVKLHLDDPEGVKKAFEASQNALDQAKARALKADKDRIGALIPEYDQEVRKVLRLHAYQAETIAEKEGALANYRKALEISVDAEIKKRGEERLDATRKLEEENTRLIRKRAIAEAEVMPDESFAGRRRAVEARRQEFQEQYQEEERLKRNKIAEDLATDEMSTRKALQLRGASQDAINKRENELATQAQKELVQLHVNTTNEIAIHDAEALKAQNELRIQQEKQLREEFLQMDVDYLQQRGELQRTYLSVQRKATFQEQLQGLEEISKIEIQTTEAVRDRQLQANKDALAQFEADHAGSMDSILEERAKFERANERIALDASAEIQKNRLELWRSTDEAILSEEMRLFDHLKGFFGSFWDALTDRSKSVWQAMGDLLKNTINNALRDIVSSRLAAAFMPLTGYPSPSFPERGRPALPFFGPLSRPPVPGLEAPGAPTARGRAESILRTSPEGSANRFIEEVAPPMVSASQALGASAVGLNTSAQALGVSAQALIASAQALAMGGGGSLGVITSIQTAGRSVQAITGSIPSSSTVASIAGVGGGLPLPPEIASVGTMPPVGATTIPGTALPFPSTAGAATLPGFSPGMAGSLGLGGARSLMSPAALQSLGLTAGLGIAMSGYRRGGVLGGAELFGGSMLAGASGAALFGSLAPAVLTPAMGAALGAGVAGVLISRKVGGVGGAAIGAFSGAVAGAQIGTMIAPGIGTLIGAGVGAIVGGIISQLPTFDKQLRDAIKRVYGIDVSSAGVRAQIAQIINDKYGGSISLGIYSTEVQEILRLYQLSQGAGAGMLPRPEYPATFAQSQAGGLQLQPVYSGGQLVASPYTGTTTAQFQNYADILAASRTSAGGVHVQLNPQQANDLLEGRVVQVISNNPSTIGQANTIAALGGYARSGQAVALMEPMTVMR